jgi:hypothetical protein
LLIASQFNQNSPPSSNSTQLGRKRHGNET